MDRKNNSFWKAPLVTECVRSKFGVLIIISLFEAKTHKVMNYRRRENIYIYTVSLVVSKFETNSQENI